MAKVTFQYRSEKSISNLTIRLLHTKEIDIRTSTPIISKREYWYKRTTKGGKTTLKKQKLHELSNNANAELKDHKEFLEEIRDSILNKFMVDFNNGVPITKDWLFNVVDDNIKILDTKNKIQTQVNDVELKKSLEIQKNELIYNKNLLSNAFKENIVKYDSNKDEQRKYKTSLKVLNKFQNYFNVEVKTGDVNQQFVDKFINWMLLVEDYKKSYVNAVLKRIVSSIKYVYYNDLEDVVKIHKQINNLNFIKNPNKDKFVTYLNYEELDKIDNTKIEDEKLLEVKKAVLLGCETGLRYGDLNKLVDENLKTFQGDLYWTFRNSKTGKVVQITRSERIQYLIDKYGLPKPFKINNDITLNRGLKTLCRIAGINNVVRGYKMKSLEINGVKQKRDVLGDYKKYNLITTRTFRRSFATNYYGIIETPLILSVTGHTTEKQLKEYISESDTSNIRRVKSQIDEFHKSRKV